MTHTFELKDIGHHFTVKKEQALPVGTGGIITVKGNEVPCTLRWCQSKKDGSVGLWFFAVKGKGSALVTHRGQKASFEYPVTLTPEQLGLKKVKPAVKPSVKPAAKPPVATKAQKEAKKKATRARHAKKAVTA